MPTGQTLGPRRYFLYTADDANTYSLLLDETLGVAGGLTLNDTNPPPPRRFKPRGVYIEATIAGAVARKFLVTSENSALYATDNSTSVTIDGTAFKTTGRRGEQMSFGSNPATGGT